MSTSARQIDEAAFGVIYGSITVMALLMAVHPPVEAPGRLAVLLFGSVFAVAIAKAYAEICQRMLQTGTAATWADYGDAWRHSRTVLLAANGPSLAFALSTLGLFSAHMALVVSQILAIGLLGWFGGRIGWRVRRTAVSMGVGAALTGGLGLLITLLKHLVH